MKMTNQPVLADKTGAAKISVISNTLLVVTKFIVGLLTGSVSIISEAAHSTVDLLAALIAYYAVATSDKSPDRNHAYGHGKIENISGAVEAALIIVAAFWIIFEAVRKLSTQDRPQDLEYGIIIMGASIMVNYFVSRRLFKVAKQTQSHALEADALHLQADIWTSVGVLAGLVAIKITGLYWLDPVIAIMVAGIIFKAGFHMTRKSMRELTDIALPQEEQIMIRTIIASHPMVKDYHRLRTRRSGSKRLVDVHVKLAPELQLIHAHEACSEIEARIKASFSPCDVIIHQEPYFAASPQHTDDSRVCGRNRNLADEC